FGLSKSPMHDAAARGCRCWPAMVAAVRYCFLASIVIVGDGRRLRFTLQALGDAPSATALSALCASEERRGAAALVVLHRCHRCAADCHELFMDGGGCFLHGWRLGFGNFGDLANLGILPNPNMIGVFW
ncbi:hypothetical protein Dimus_017978, partial [Dionaea muscipula]